MKCRLLLLLLLVSCSCLSQTLLDQPVSLSRRSGSVGEYLKDLTDEGIQISYSSAVVNTEERVRLDGQEKTVGDVLRAILKNQALRIAERNGRILLIATRDVKKKYTISGFITDKKSGERLIGASVFLPGKRLGTTSNVYGFYSITLEEDTLDFQVSYSGFVTYFASIHLVKDLQVDIQMEPAVIINEPVIVNSEGRKNVASRAVGKNDVSSGFIKSLPSLMGEADVFKSLQLLPGVQGSNEGSSGLNVRGGSPDQNLILIDGVPVYNASHAFGLFSVFNADAVNSVEIIKSGFPASYGGRLSSVIDVHMKEGDKYELHGEGGIGLVFSKLTIEGPIRKGKSSFLLSARRTYFDLLFDAALDASDAQAEFKPFFSDINAKANFPVGKNDRIYFSLYLGKDSYRSSDWYDNYDDSIHIRTTYTQAFSWGNITGLVRWNHVLSKKMFSNLTLTYSRYRFRNRTSEERESNVAHYGFLSDQRYFSGIQDLNFKMDVDYLPSPNHFIKMGFSSILHHYEPGISSFRQRDTVIKVDTEVDNHSLYALETDMYVEDDVRISPRMKMNAGLRFGSFLVKQKFMASLQPRLNLVFKLHDRWSLKASAGTMRQFIHLLANSNLGLPTDLWLPVTRRVPPQKSVQFTTGAVYRHDKSLEASMEVYYKDMKNVIDYSEGSAFGSAYNNWEDMVEIGSGKAYGIEWMLQKRKGKVSGLVSYTLGKSTRTFAAINDGKSFPYKYDRRHEVKTAVIWKPSQKFELGANWLFSTGNAISLPEAYYYDPFTNRYVDIYTARNNFRMPNYHRLDLSVKFTKQKKRHLRIWTFHIYNAYNHFNTFFIYKGEDILGSPGDVHFREVSVFPIIPSFSYQFKF